VSDRAGQPDVLSHDCWTSHHASCGGYTDDPADPDLCDCPCHDDVAAAFYASEEL
jgi:hypothetical protein